MSVLNLTGAWFGKYDYANVSGQSVAFIAALTETDGGVSGTISEPNNHGVLSDYVRALVDGTRSGMAVAFVKAYDGAADYAHCVVYNGLLNNAGTEISGRWIIDGKLTGSFVMNREHPGVDEEIEDVLLVKG
jgi:hypothetical protein